MLQTDMYSYNTEDYGWHKYGIADVDRNEVRMSLVYQYTCTILAAILKLCSQSRHKMSVCVVWHVVVTPCSC